MLVSVPYVETKIEYKNDYMPLIQLNPILLDHSLRVLPKQSTELQ